MIKNCYLRRPSDLQFRHSIVVGKYWLSTVWNRGMFLLQSLHPYRSICLISPLLASIEQYNFCSLPNVRWQSDTSTWPWPVVVVPSYGRTENGKLSNWSGVTMEDNSFNFLQWFVIWINHDVLKWKVKRAELVWCFVLIKKSLLMEQRDDIFLLLCLWRKPFNYLPLQRIDCYNQMWWVTARSLGLQGGSKVVIFCWELSVPFESWSIRRWGLQASTGRWLARFFKHWQLERGSNECMKVV